MAGYFVAAALLHAALLFGFRMESAAVPLPVNDDTAPVDVSLVEAAPAPPAPAASVAPAVTPQPESTPEPTPDMTPEPTPDVPTPEATPEMETPTPVPERETMAESTPTHPKPHPVEHRHPHSAPGPAAQIAGTAASGAHGPTGHGAAGGAISTQARYLSNPRPDYPEEERVAHHQGVVYLSVEVGADGRPSDVSISRSSGYPRLDDSAARAVRRWTFEPARAGGLPVASHVEIPIHFSLSSY